MSRFDRWVLLTLLGLTGAVVGVVGRGDQIGVQVIQVSPTEGLSNVSTRAVIQVGFDQDLRPDNSSAALVVTPPVSGTVRWQGKALSFFPAALLAPDTLYTVTLPMGLKSQQGRGLLQAYSWRFHTRQRRFLFTRADGENRIQVFALWPDQPDAAPIQLTFQPSGVSEYAVSPDGDSFVYAVTRSDESSDLWLAAVEERPGRMVLACPNANCGGLSWSPEGRRLLYERREMAAPGQSPDQPRLWWLDIATGKTIPLFTEETPASTPRPAPVGPWLSYVSPVEHSGILYNPAEGQARLLSNGTEEPVVWNPRGDAVAFVRLRVRVNDFVYHLGRMDLASGQVTELSGGDNDSDTAPAWSPDGKQVAFIRRELTEQGLKVEQVWMVRSDGSNAQPITDDPTAFYASPAWSPDGRYLLFVRYPLSGSIHESEIWRWDSQTGERKLLTQPGYFPRWRP